LNINYTSDEHVAYASFNMFTNSKVQFRQIYRTVSSKLESANLLSFDIIRIIRGWSRDYIDRVDAIDDLSAILYYSHSYTQHSVLSNKFI